MQKNGTFKSIVLTSTTPHVTANFYRGLLDLPLDEEQHRGTARHFAAQVGDQHFAIHQRDGFWIPSDQPATIVSFTADVDAVAARLEARGEILARTRIGPMPFIAVRDPDGRVVCFGAPWPEKR